MSAPDWLERRRSAALAGHTGDVATARALLADPDARVRATALGALARAEALRAADLDAALADPDPVMRRRGATEVARRSARLAGRAPEGDAPILVSLLATLDDPDATVVEVAAWACGEQQPPEPGAVAKLVALTLGHDDPLVREAAVASLGAIGDPTGLDAILAATTDKPAVRRRAVLALAPFDGPEVDAALEAAKSDRDWQVRQAAEDLTDPS